MNPTVEDLLAEIQREREKTSSLCKEQDSLKSVLRAQKGRNDILSKTLVKATEQKDEMVKELDSARANSLNITEKNGEYVDQIEIALTDVQYGDMSLGDLYRLSSIYLNELTRVNTMISKITNKQ